MAASTTGRGAANFLTRVTAGLAAAFFATSMILTLLATRPTATRSIFDTQPSTPAKGPADKAQPAQLLQKPGRPAAFYDKIGATGAIRPQVPRPSSLVRAPSRTDRTSQTPRIVQERHLIAVNGLVSEQLCPKGP